MEKTYSEIRRQYRTLEQTRLAMEKERDALHRLYVRSHPRRVIFLGSGSSFHLAQSAELIARTEFGIDAASLAAGDLMVNFDSYAGLFADSLPVAITRSGNTTEIVRTLSRARREWKLPTAAITCAEGSAVEEAAELVVRLPWAFDESVCQTGTVSNLYAASAMLVAAFAGSDGIFGEFRGMAEPGEAFIGRYEPEFKKIAQIGWENAVVLADGVIAGLANEASLAFKEISGTFSNCHQLLDVRHGPMVLINGKTLVVASLSAGEPSAQLALVADLARRGAAVVAVTDESFASVPHALLHCRHAAPGPVTRGLPLLNAVQLIAYYKALGKGLDPGNPVGLDAWIDLDAGAK